MVRLISFSVSSNFKCGPMQLYLLDPQMWLEGSYELGSVHPSVLTSGSFLGIGSLVFSEIQHVLGLMCCCAWQPDFLKKIFLPKNWGKWAKNGQKIGFFKVIRKFSHQFFLKLVYNESLYYLLYSCTNPIFGKNLVREM